MPSCLTRVGHTADTEPGFHLLNVGSKLQGGPSALYPGFRRILSLLHLLPAYASHRTLWLPANVVIAGVLAEYLILVHTSTWWESVQVFFELYSLSRGLEHLPSMS